jgi:acyl carrier protein phosphodiesterase
MLGGLLGDFVRGRRALRAFPPGVSEGIQLHRWIDTFTDADNTVEKLRSAFPPAFRRWAGIIIDMAFDHQLASRWSEFSEQSLVAFDRQIRSLLEAHADLLPPDLVRFMEYADRRGLFATYRFEQEMLFSLRGVGTRLRRSNPLDRVHEVWPQVREPCRLAFEDFFPRLQAQVDQRLARRSTITGS